MHLPGRPKEKWHSTFPFNSIEIPPLDPMKVTQRPNMRRLNLIQINELDFAPGKSTILGQGAFGIVYAVSLWPFTIIHQRLDQF